MGIADAVNSRPHFSRQYYAKMSLPLIGWLSSIRRSGRTGPLRSEAALVHGGQTTQVWDAQVTRGDGRTAGVFRCT
jgi:hypothetical protein